MLQGPRSYTIFTDDIPFVLAKYQAKNISMLMITKPLFVVHHSSRSI